MIPNRPASLKQARRVSLARFADRIRFARGGALGFLAPFAGWRPFARGDALGFLA